MSASNYLENEILDHVLGEGARDFTSPAALYVALFTADPGESGSFTSEVANSNGYSRQAVNFNTASSGSATNNGALTFTASGGNWGTISHVAVVDNGTHGAGNVLFYGSLTASKQIDNGDTLSIADTALSISLN